MVNKPISIGIEPVSSFSSIIINNKVESQRRKVRKIKHICVGIKYDSKTENSCLPIYRVSSLVNTPISVGIVPVRSFPSIIIYRVESQRRKVRTMEQNC